MGRIDGIRLKIARAQKHILDLEKELTVFLSSDPYEFRRDFEHNIHTAFRLIRSTPIPPSFALITGDAIQNLRTTLDHLVWQLVEVEVGKPAKPKRISFPIYGSLEEYETGFPEKMKAMKLGPTTVAALAALKPYRGGNDTLWLISELNNIDKHRLLVTVAAYLDKLLVQVDPFAIQELAPEIPAELLGGPDQPPVAFDIVAARPNWHSTNAIFYTPGNVVDDAHFELTVNVSLAELGVPPGESLLVTLRGMLNLVDSVVSALRAFSAPVSKAIRWVESSRDGTQRTTI